MLGSFVAIAIVRYRFRGGAAVNFLLVLPLTAPEIVLGASLLTLFLEPHLVLGNVNFQLGFATILIADMMFCVSYVALTVKARIRGFDWTLEDAAMDLGAGPARTFFKVTLPLILPGDPGRVHAVVRTVDRRLHHHVLRVRTEHHHVPDPDLQPVADRDAGADQRVGIDDPVRQRVGDDHRQLVRPTSRASVGRVDVRRSGDSHCAREHA